MKTILDAHHFNLVVQRLAHQLIEKHDDFADTVILGIQQGGVAVADEIVKVLQLHTNGSVKYGQIDITFYRDDIRKKILAPDSMNIPFDIENKNVVLIDDVLFTGRTIKAALDVLLDYGRPARVELCVLIDRKEHRQFPIQPDYTGQAVRSVRTDKIKVVNDESDQKQVVLYNE